MIRKTIVATLVVFSAFALVTAQRSQDALMLLDNTETVVRYGLDSTGSWWAVTQPYEQFVNMYINGKRYGPYTSTTDPAFATDGSTWTFAAIRDLRAYVCTPAGERAIDAEEIVGVGFASQSPVPWVEYTISDVRTTTNGTQTYTTNDAIGPAMFDPAGLVVWHKARRGTQIALVGNGVDEHVYDDIIMAGVWSDGRPVFAATGGTTWSVFIGEQELVPNLQSVSDLKVNSFGTVLAFNASRSSAPINSYMYTDDYRNPWTGPNLDVANALVLSPCCDLVAVLGKVQGGSSSVIFNSASYPAGTQSSLPAFSFDGAHMAFLGNDGEGFVSMDGRRSIVKGGGSAASTSVAVAPTGRSVAWVSASTLVVYDILGEGLGMGKMCDSMGRDAIFNRSKNIYQALGVFGGRLFLLSSPAP